MAHELLEENANFARGVIESDTSPSKVTLVASKIRLKGSAVVVDGEGTLLAMESSIINENRNSAAAAAANFTARIKWNMEDIVANFSPMMLLHGLSWSTIETELRRLLGVEKIIWFPGREGLDVTDVHIDAEVNFVRSGVVVLSRPHPNVLKLWLDVFKETRQILSQSVDAKGRRFEIHIVDEPDPKFLGHLSYDDPATNYVNFYFVNGGLIIPQFGDKQRDQEALALFQKLCPNRVVQPVHVTGLPLAGGVLHCATQPVLSADEE